MKKFTSVLAFAAVAGFGFNAAQAQDDIPVGGEGDYSVAAAGPGAEWFPDDGRLGPFSVTAGVDMVTSYFFRGYEQEDSGAIFQPWVEVGMVLYENENGPINGVDVYVGWWNSVHTEDNTAGGNSNWYETDIYTGFNVGFLDYFTFGFAFIDYEYPGLGATAIREIDLSLEFDDSSFWTDIVPLEGFGIYPYALYAIEIQNSPSEISNAYFETGVAPGFDIPVTEEVTVGFSFPMYVGLSIDNYYGNEVFGYFAFGPQFSLPLSFIIPEDFGDVELTAGVTGLYLNDSVGLTDTPGSDLEVYGNFGISWSY